MKTHGLIDTFAEDGKNEESCNRWREVAGDGLDVIEELAALGRLDDGDPGDAHPDEGQDENPAARQGQVWTFELSDQTPAGRGFTCQRSSALSHWLVS